MDIMSIAPGSPTGTPTHISDKRPTADAAAISRAPSPEAPLGPMALAVPGLSQVAAVSQSQLAGAPLADTSRTNATEQAERTLKPYGVSMLPQSDTRKEAAEEAKRQAQKAADEASTARAGQAAQAGSDTIRAAADPASETRPVTARPVTEGPAAETEMFSSRPSPDIPEKREET